MKKCAWLLLQYFLLFTQNTFAQDASYSQKYNHPSLPSFKITDSLPEEFNIDISNYVAIYNHDIFETYEKKGTLNFNDELIKHDGFKKPFLNPVNEVAILFRIINSSAKEKRIYFQCGNADLLKITDINDSLKQIQTGGFLGSSNRIAPFSPNKYLLIKISAKTSVSLLAYAKFMGTYKEKVEPRLLSERSYQLNSIHDIDKGRLQLVYHSIIIGGILIISIFMFAQFFQNKDKAYVYYAAYGLCMSLLSEKIMELNCGINLISYFFPYYVFYSHLILQLLACFFYTGFLNFLLEISEREKAIYWYNKIMQKLVLFGCILYCVAIFSKTNSIFTTVAFSYGTFISTIAMLPLLILLIMLKKKDPAVKLVIAGFSAVVTGALAVVYINRSGLYSKFNVLAPVSIIEFGIFVEMIFFGLALGYKTHKQKKEKENIELQKKETEMAALKAQMNPHFMFNCINSIDSFIQTNDKYNATLYLNKFARLIRNVLDSSKENVVPFSKDIETLKLYIELEELRSDNKFKTNLQIDDDLLNDDFKVPPLIIQPFVENAILHGLKNREDNTGLLSISIQKQNNSIYYLITDNGIGRLAASKIIQNKESHFGMQMSFDRIKLFNKESTPSVVITDLYNGQQASGTKIEIHLNIV